MADAPKRTLRALTGVKPTAVPHVGNYLGAIRPALELTKTYESFLFIADLHALTTEHDPARLRESTYSVAATWLAFGLDPKKVVFYKQSDVAETVTLSWILSCFTPMGLLMRGHSFYEALEKDQGSVEETRRAIKEAIGSGDAARQAAEMKSLDINHGVFAYPVLMAADILLYDADVVPVGKDQKQHLEITQEIARKFNNAYGREVLRIPEARIDEQVMTIPGLDGRKMSKSYGNTIVPFDSDKELKKRLGLIKTDSTPYGQPLDPNANSLFALFKLLSSSDQATLLERRYRAGRKDPDLPQPARDEEANFFGWGAAKDALHKALIDTFGPARTEYQRLMNDKPYLDQLLAEGAERARTVARGVLGRAMDACGLVLRR